MEWWELNDWQHELSAKMKISIEAEGSQKNDPSYGDETNPCQLRQSKESVRIFTIFLFLSLILSLFLFLAPHATLPEFSSAF